MSVAAKVSVILWRGKPNKESIFWSDITSRPDGPANHTGSNTIICKYRTVDRAQTSTRYLGTIHDFMMLNPIADTPAVLDAVEQASEILKKVLTAGK